MNGRPTAPVDCGGSQRPLARPLSNGGSRRRSELEARGRFNTVLRAGRPRREHTLDTLLRRGNRTTRFRRLPPFRPGRDDPVSLEETHACWEVNVCALVDANFAHEVFGVQSVADRGRLLPVGHEGKRASRGRRQGAMKNLSVAQTTSGSGQFQAVQAGTMTIASESYLEKRTQQVEANGEYQSDDPHVLALAQVSGDRLLDSNDSALQGDFKNRRLIDNPRGRV